MSDVLESAWLKFGRALVHLRSLATAISEWRDREPYRIDNDVRHRARKGRCRITMKSWVTILEDGPADAWAPIVGDCLHNLHSALDHIAYQAVEPPMRDGNTGFPIFEIKDRVRKNAQTNRAARSGFEPDGRSKLAGAPPAIVRLAESAQPYHGLNGLDAHPLWRLKWLSNVDKHRTVHISSSAFDLGIHVTIDAPGWKVIERWNLPLGSPLHAARGKTLITQLVVEAPGERPHVGFQSSLVPTPVFIGGDGLDGLAGMAVQETLERIALGVQWLLRDAERALTGQP